MKKENYFITTPIYYSNDKPHIGSAYTTIAADILARWQRAKGRRVYFQTGVDEHGAKMAKAAEIAGIKNVKEFTNKRVKFFTESWNNLDITYDHFIRTTDEKHEKYVQNYLAKIWKKGEIYKGVYKGLYCLGCEEFKDRKELVDGKCPLHNSKPQSIEETNYFFKLSNYQQKLIDIIKSDDLRIEPQQRKNEVLSFLKNEKLADISISREKVEWGIKVPWDKTQTVYCWVDALLNYLSAGEKYWPADLHLIGKDIIKFHCIIWPALLLANGYQPPKRVFAHGFFTLEGKKISKTMGNIIYIEDLLKTYPSDAIRYLIFKEIYFGQDGDFSLDSIKQRYNADLANNLGNLVQRVSNMLVKYFDGQVDQVESSARELKQFEIVEIWEKLDQSLNQIKFHEALKVIWQLIDKANRYIEEKKPWSSDVSSQKLILGNLIEIIREIAEMILPFMPNISTNIQNQFKGPRIKAGSALFPRKE
ncbi:MAG: methionine--tRNA ligase [Candidatus Berkelbacteria bacterium]|nr:methionine--tRNA ligase [Candidatus Berkelbacteria bacterium]